MEFVARPFRQGHFGPTLMEFVGKAIFLGPTLMEFVGKAISDHFGPRVWALGFWALGFRP